MSSLAAQGPGFGGGAMPCACRLHHGSRVQLGRLVSKCMKGDMRLRIWGVLGCAARWLLLQPEGESLRRLECLSCLQLQKELPSQPAVA